jgi:hypothetical protein
METSSDPLISAVVTVGDVAGKSPGTDVLGKVKTRFAGIGFEVHAPFGPKFSIGARQSVFEKAFATKLNVEQESLAVGVTTESGNLDLPLDQLPDDLRESVASVEFVPPPTFATPGSPPE